MSVCVCGCAAPCFPVQFMLLGVCVFACVCLVVCGCVWLRVRACVRDGLYVRIRVCANLICIYTNSFSLAQT